MWTYIPEYLRYTWLYVQLAWAVYIGPFIKPKGVARDTKENDNG